MAATRHDVWQLLTYVQDDLRQTQTKLVELRTMLAAGALDRDNSGIAHCPHCPVQLGPRQLAEHLANVHDQENT